MLYVCLHLNVNICNIILHYLSVLLGILHKKIGFTWTVIVPSQKKLTCHKLMFYALNQIVSNFSYFKLWLFDLTVQWVFKVSCNLLNERCKKMFSLPTFHERAGGGDRAYTCNKNRGNMIFCKPAVRCTLLFFNVVNLDICIHWNFVSIEYSSWLA